MLISGDDSILNISLLTLTPLELLWINGGKKDTPYRSSLYKLRAVIHF